MDKSRGQGDENVVPFDRTRRRTGPESSRRPTEKTTNLLKEAILLAVALCGRPKVKIVRVKVAETVTREHDPISGRKVEKIVERYEFRRTKEFDGKDGMVGYLMWLAQDHPRAFAPLLVKTMLLQVQQGDTDATTEEPKLETPEDVRQHYRNKGLPDRVARDLAEQVFSIMASRKKDKNRERDP